MPYKTHRTTELPELLKDIPDAPKTLYYKGNWNPDIFQNCLAVVGSRKMTSYGRRAVEKIVTDVAASGITIVSGFMYGVDAAAHRAAIVGGGKTIAVMPCGIERIHPEYQDELYNDILENNGLIISEYGDDDQPQYWTYPKRNRIVAGLSAATLIVEAATKSGSLITANLTKKYNRTIFVVPGPITSSVSEGTSQLLKDGAIPVTCAEDILSYYSEIAPHKKSSSTETLFEFASLGKLEKMIVEQLRQEPQDVDMLARALEKSASEVGTTLSLMQLRGIVLQDGRVYYVR